MMNRPPSLPISIGIDEVGRGPLAGPVMACALWLPPDFMPLGLADSKALTARQRERLAAELDEAAVYALGLASVEEIDAINILEATMLAMERAVAGVTAKLGCTPNLALIDGNRAPKGLPCAARTIVRGDASEPLISAASIVAKVARDRLMKDLDVEYPGYGWAKNAGYGSAAHMEALSKLGPTPHHRRSFAPVAAAVAAQKVMSVV